MSSANTESFTSSFPVCIPFISFSSLIAVAKTSKTILNSSCHGRHPCLVPDFRGNAFKFLTLRIMFAVGLLYMAFIMLRYVPSMPAFWRVFITNGGHSTFTNFLGEGKTLALKKHSGVLKSISVTHHESLYFVVTSLDNFLFLLNSRANVWQSQYLL